MLSLDEQKLIPIPTVNPHSHSSPHTFMCSVCVVMFHFLRSWQVICNFVYLCLTVFQVGFMILHSHTWRFHLCTSLPTFVIFCLIYYIHFSGDEMILICISLMSKDVENLFMYLRTVIYSLGKCLFIPIFKNWDVGRLLELKELFINSGYKSFIRYMFCKCFPCQLLVFIF